MIDKDWKFDGTDKVEKYQREMQLLINLVEPDPEFQPAFVGDSACLFDCVGTDETVTLQRLKEYFGESFAFPLSTPMPKLVQILKNAYHGWPDEPFVPAYEAQSNK